MGKADDVAKILRDIRDKEKNDRKDCCMRLFEKLGYKKATSLSIAQFDAFLVKAIKERFDVSPESDIVLMAFGLLKGYEYSKTTISDRREKYLRESNYLRTNPRSKIKDFTTATTDEQENEIENFRNGGEARPIKLLAEFLIKQNITEYISDLDGHITKGKNPNAILPKPSYNSSDEMEATSADAKAEVRHAKKFNSNRNKNTTVVKVINIIGGDNSSESKDLSDRGKDAVHIGGVTVWIKQYKVVSSFAVLCCVLLVFLFFPWQRNHSPASTDAQIKVPEETITMQPGGAYKMSPVLLSGASMEMKDAEFSYISSNPNIVQVLQSGLLCAQNELADGASVSAEITIQGPDNVTQKNSGYCRKVSKQ